jgi:hypothetical protein
MRLLVFLLLGALTACSTPLELVPSVTVTPTAIALSTSTSLTVAPATRTPLPLPSFAPTPLPTHIATRRSTVVSESASVRPTKVPTSTPKPITVVAAPPGMIYSDNEGQWQIAAGGRSKSVNTPESVQAPYFYYASVNKNNLTDIWAEEVATSKRRNLTNTPDRYEDPPLAWPQNPDILLFYSTPGMPDGAGYIGELTIMHTDGTGYQVVSQKDVSSPAAFSPDGRTIAYAIYADSNPAPWFYRVGSQPQRFPWKNFGLEHFKTMGFSSPSWSPDGRKIAWWMWSYDEYNKELFDGIGLFDLEKGYVALLDDFSQFVPDGWPSAVEWSPNGERVLFFAQHLQGQEQQTDGIWIANADGRNLRQLFSVGDVWYSCHWAWQPDGLWFAISCSDPEFGPGIWLAKLETGKLLKTNLPDDAQIRGWVNPQP